MTFVSTFLLSFVIVLLAVTAMAIGALVGRRRIQGSCGGVADGACRLCGRGSDTAKAPECEKQEALP